jgi:small-conductance mechanosensitive channel
MGRHLSSSGVFPFAADVVTPAEVDACGQDAGAACLFVVRQTDNVVLARAADWLVAKPIKIALIVLVSVVLYQVISRGISKFIRSISEASAQRRLAEIGDQVPGTLVATAPVEPRAIQRAETIGVVLRSVAKGAIAILALLMILSEFGINLGPLIAGAGIVGVALGFGSQSLVKDFLSGMFLLVEDQFGVGDVVDVGEATGTVEGVSLRTTRLRDVEGTVWHVPNGEIRRVGNKSQQWSRALLDVQVAYDSDLDHARRLIKQVADEVWHDEEIGASVLEEPEVWGVENFGPTGIAIRLVVKTKPADQWKVLRELRSRLKRALEEEGIQIGFQQGLVLREGSAPTPPPAPPG